MLLAIYRPTLSLDDQHTLSCMHQYEKSGYSMVSSFVWGEAALKNLADKNQIKTNLFEISKLDQILNSIDDRMMSKSILFYPVTRRLRVRLFFAIYGIQSTFKIYLVNRAKSL